MMINRHNYEEFLLMYVDNELNLHQRMEVELFMEQNPDLAAELHALQEAVLLPEPQVTFQHKQSLYKQAEGLVTPENCEEQFLLYIDNELDTAARTRVEAFLQQYPQQQQQFALLQQTVLTAEPVIFANKKVLYKKEKERRIIPFSWTRLAVAAALLGVTATAGWWFFNNEKAGNDSIAVVTPGANKPEKASGSQIDQPGGAAIDTNNQPVAEIPPAKSNTSQPAAQKQPSVNGISSNEQSNLANNSNAASSNNSTAVKNNQPAAASQEVVRPENTGIAQVTTTNDGILARNQETQAPIATGSLPVKTVIIPASQPEHAVAAPKQNDTHKAIAYKELDTSEDDQSVYVGALELNRNKVKGFFRKAGRLIGTKAKAVTEENL